MNILDNLCAYRTERQKQHTTERYLRWRQPSETIIIHSQSPYNLSFFFVFFFNSKTYPRFLFGPIVSHTTVQLAKLVDAGKWLPTQKSHPDVGIDVHSELQRSNSLTCKACGRRKMVADTKYHPNVGLYMHP